MCFSDVHVVFIVVFLNTFHVILVETCNIFVVAFSHHTSLWCSYTTDWLPHDLVKRDIWVSEFISILQPLLKSVHQQLLPCLWNNAGQFYGNMLWISNICSVFIPADALLTNSNCLFNVDPKIIATTKLKSSLNLILHFLPLLYIF